MIEDLKRKIEDQAAELKARGEILDTIQKAVGEGCWPRRLGGRMKSE